MTDEKNREERQQLPRVKNSRQDRLKLALRENLKRRKVQARERSKMTDASSTDDDASLHGEVGKRGDQL